MAIEKYKTKAGVRYLATVYRDGVRVARQGGFKSKLAAHQWEEENKKPQTSESRPSDLALWEVVTLYLLDAEERRKKNTLSYKKSVLNKFSEFVGPDAPFREVERGVVKTFLNKSAKDVSPKSANKYRVELSALWSWANIEGHAAGNPARQVEPFSVTKHVRYVPPQDHIAKVLKNASQFQRDFISALLHTAGRISELRELTWGDVDLERGTVCLWTSKRRGGDKEARRLALSPTLKEIFTRLSEQRTGGETYVFTNPHTGRGYNRQSREIKYMFQEVCAAAEVPLFTAHSLRHFIATHFDDPRRAQKILGHSNLKTTEIYLHDLGVDIGAAAIFESITNRITNESAEPKDEGPTVFQ